MPDINFNVVLVEPQIPQNTGSTARLTAANYDHLHIVQPTAFELSDKQVKRAGLDYWPEVKLSVHQSWDAFADECVSEESNLWFFSTKAEQSYTSASFSPGDYLIFGNETKGLAPEFHEKYADRMLCIPQANPNIRSLNLATAVGITLYEARRQRGSF